MMPLLVEAVWFILPAYIANSIAIDVSIVGFLKKYSHPIDGGVKWRGRRLLGDGKTWRGLAAGILAGTLAGLLQNVFHTQAQTFLSVYFNSDLNLPQMTLTLAFMISLGAMVGDLVASFGKRRIGLESGSPAPLLDQLDYIFGAFLFAWVIYPIRLNYFAAAVIFTIPLHLFANVVAWALKIKKVPW